LSSPRTYTVFHVERLDRLPPSHQEVGEPFPDKTVYDEAQRLISECSVHIIYGGTKPAYDPQRDEIMLPPFSWLESEEGFLRRGFP